MPMPHPFTLRGAGDRPIRGDAWPAKDDLRGDRPCVVVIHGFKGFKDWGFFPWLGASLAEAGYNAITFNLSHNGIGEDLQSFSELGAFETDTWGLRLFDLGVVLEALADGISCEDGVRLQAESAALLGHSMGGGLAVLAAGLRARGADVPEWQGRGAFPKLVGVIGWNPVAHANRFEAEALQQLEREGKVDVVNARTGQVLHVGKAFFDDLAGPQRAIEGEAMHTRCPVLVISGEDDPVVPTLEANSLASVAPAGRLEVISGAGHTMNAKHPFDAGAPPELEQAFALSLQQLGTLSSDQEC